MVLSALRMFSMEVTLKGILRFATLREVYILPDELKSISLRVFSEKHSNT